MTFVTRDRNYQRRGEHLGVIRLLELGKAIVPARNHERRSPSRRPRTDPRADRRPQALREHACTAWSRFRGASRRGARAGRRERRRQVDADEDPRRAPPTGGRIALDGTTSSRVRRPHWPASRPYPGDHPRPRASRSSRTSCSDVAAARPRLDWWSARARAAEVLESSGHRPVRAGGSAPAGRTQLVEIARALSIDARVLILDEPTSSLTDDEVESLFRVVRRLRDEGVAVIFVSHRLRRSAELGRPRDRAARRPHRRRRGRRRARPAEADRADGRPRARRRASRRRDQQPAAGPRAQVRGLTLPGALRRVALDVAPGEIVGLAGSRRRRAAAS